MKSMQDHGSTANWLYLAALCLRQEQAQVTLMDLVLATCSSFDCVAEACDIVAVSCTCRQTKVVIPASTILRTCASPLSRDLCEQQLIVDTNLKSIEANRYTSVFVTKVKPPNCGDSVILEIYYCTFLLKAMMNRSD